MNQELMRNSEDIIYSINIEDLQNVAKEELSRELTDEEIHFIEGKIGDFIDWHEAIASTIQECLEKTAKGQVKCMS